MRKLFSTIIFLCVAYMGWSQNNLSVNSVNTQWPDTTTVNASHSFIVSVMNDSSTIYNDSLFLEFAVDTGSGLNTVEMIEVSPGSGTVINGMDTATFGVTHDFLNTRYAPGNNVVVIWPVNGTGERGDSLMLDVFVVFPNSVADIDLSDYINVFPNPALNQLTIQNDYSSDPINYRVFSSAGKLVLSGLSDSPNLNVEALESGMYVLKLDVGEMSTTVRIIKK